MKIYKSDIYINDLKNAIDSTNGFDLLENKSVMITGATGLIGSFLTDMLIYANDVYNLNIKVYAVGRSIERLKRRFDKQSNDNLYLIEQDVNNNISFDFDIDYIIHSASNAYPKVFSEDPVGTIMSNIIGTKNLLDYGVKHGCSRFLFVSSGEVYGQFDTELDSFSEEHGGYVNPTHWRSCYPSSKRTAETLCTSYTKQYGIDTVIVRPCHIFGPTSTSFDNRANVQFINNVLAGEDIILKSDGVQTRSYCYIADCASAIVTILLKGESCEAYNIAPIAERVTIAEFAKKIADIGGKKVIFEKADYETKEQSSPIPRQVLNAHKLENLGWTNRYSIDTGIENTINILK